MQFLSIFLIIFASLSLVQGARILAIFPFPGPSQYILVQPLLKALAARGHELTVLSHFPQKEKIANFRDIKLEYENYYDSVIKPAVKLRDGPEAAQLFFEFFRNVSIKTLQNTEVQALLKSKSEHFDLVIAETLLAESLYAMATHFKAPLIGVSSFGTDPTIDSLVGNASPICYLPLVTSALTDRMNFWQRLENLKLIVDDWKHIQFHHLPVQEKLYRKYFPHLKANLEDIYKNFSLVFVNQHFSLSFPRPYVPAMIEVAGMHISQKATPLPKDIADFIDGAKHGAIYFAMGSNVKSQDFPEEKIKTLLKVFGRLKQRVMWKFERTQLPGKPDNVFISKWFPQSDILAHPNVKLFITHSGLLSTIEAIHHAMPIVGIPLLYDQFLNMKRAQLAGYGVGVDYNSFTETELLDAIREVLENPSYKKIATEISARYHDRLVKPLDTAIYWTEYILRHKGAPHLRVAAQDLSFIAYHSLDTWGYVILTWAILPLLLVVVAFKLLKWGSKTMLHSEKRKRE